MAKHYDRQFKLDAIQYYHDHRELGLQGCASNLEISHQTLSRWRRNCVTTESLRVVVLATMHLMKQKKSHD